MSLDQDQDPKEKQPSVATPQEIVQDPHPPRFANLYWTIDYITGLNRLKSQSFKSIKQLHELRKLVFNYMSYFHANSEFLNKSSIELFPIESTFLPFESDKSTNTSASSSRNITPLTSPHRKRLDNAKHEEHEINMCTAYGKYIDQMSLESALLLNLTSIIDRDVLEDITHFLKFHEPQINKQFGRLDGIYDDYLKSRKTVEKLKTKHAEQLRLKEFAQHEEPSFEESYADEELEEDDEEEAADKELELDFPLQLGTVVVSDPVAGYKNQIFSSDSLTSVLLKYPVRGLKPSRVNLEKFGQGLLDLKFITSNNFFNNKKFKSEGLWFEWSDLAIHYSEFKKSSSLETSSVKDTNSVGTSATASTTTNKSSSAIGSPKTNKFMADMAETTTRFNAMTNYNEVLEDLENKYSEEILNLQEQKYLLENGLLEISKSLESFEHSKVEIIYKSLSRLLEILFDKAEKFSNDFIHNINKTSHYDRDFYKTMENFSTGIYFSSLISPDTSARHKPGSSSSTTFQNLKYQFDLYKDIPLQLQNNFNCDSESLLSIASIPSIFQWKLKQDITMLISDFTPDLKNDLANKNLIEQEFINQVLNHLKSLKTNSVIVFIKNWLLDISDSVIPFVIFDSLMNLYNDNADVPTEELVKILSTIPRSNLSSLIYIIEYISNLFELGDVPSYEISDELPDESLMPQINPAQIQEVCNKLNSMDEIGSIPLMHLILRPSSSKNATGFKPPLDKYKRLLTDLLKLNVRTQLLKHLVENETNYKSKKEAEKLQCQRTTQTPVKSNSASANLAQPRPDSEEFTLRPFRTRATPNPSPQASPKREPSEPFNKSMSPARELLPPPATSNGGGHKKSPSTTNFMVPKIDIEFEE
ncbi:hypothetical protein Cantr_06902 [Candida viswanathii]|uniref:Rho-GAP domain-containing protein n=1 Tax=Candida viswanathii TaxID=5486 RepID=A0A367XWG8_9ASCO|nr:hypothetical protein Cantr_06902 [Candida viswanathii]